MMSEQQGAACPTLPQTGDIHSIAVGSKSRFRKQTLFCTTPHLLPFLMEQTIQMGWVKRWLLRSKLPTYTPASCGMHYVERGEIHVEHELVCQPFVLCSFCRYVHTDGLPRELSIAPVRADHRANDKRYLRLASWLLDGTRNDLKLPVGSLP